MSDEGEAARPEATRPERPCPICGREATREFFPFCSKRCADVDLHRWFSGVYAVPAAEAESEGDEDEER